MANEKTEEKAKPTLATEFRKKLKNREQLKATVTEGLKSTNSRVRALAIKAAFKIGEHAFVKQNVLPLIKADKSKKVLRAISQKITRRDLYKKVKASRVMKKLGGNKETASTDGAAPAAAGSNEAKPSKLLLLTLISTQARAAFWPDAPWLNRLPQNNATASAVAFISPYDLQFYRIMAIWRKLEKKYSNLQINFIIVAMGEQGLPMTDEVVRNILKDNNYTLPVLLDQYSTYAKSVHAYVSPTVNLILRDGRITNFDAGNLDPALFEKTLQKALKENPVAVVPPREFTNDGEVKACGHNHTIFVGERFGKAWSPESFIADGPWVPHPLWLESDGTKRVQVELNPLKSSLGILAEALPGKSARLNIFLDGTKIPNDLRGRDVQEDKNGNTFILIQGLKMYDAISHSAHIKDPGLKFSLSTESKGLRLRALETLPACLEAD